MMLRSSRRSSLPGSSNSNHQRTPAYPSTGALRIALSYVVTAGAYIFVSDHLAASLATDVADLTVISEIKGWGFVLITGALLYVLVQRRMKAQQEIEQQLRESNERLSRITSASPVSLFEVNAEGTILFAAGRFDEHALHDAVGASVYSLVPEEHRETMRKLVSSVLGTSLEQSLEYTARTGLLGEHTFSVTISPLHQAEGVNDRRLLVTAYDITDIRKIEEQARLQARLLDAADEAVVATDAEGTIWYWNAAATRMHGWEKGEALGRSVADLLISPAFREHAKAVLERIRQEGRWSGEVSTLRKDGTTFPALVSISLLLDEKGRDMGFVCVSRDISEQKRTAEELERSYERLDLISRASNDAVWDWDVRTNQIWWNDAFYRTFGFSRDFEPTFDAWAQRVHPEDRDRVLQSLQQALERRSPTWSQEYRFMHANGSISYIVDRGFLVCDADGKPVRMVGSMVDVTSLKLAELDQRFLAEERQKLLQQLRLQFERMPIGYILVDRHFRITEWNPMCEKIFGFGRGEVLGRSPFDLIIPPSARAYVQEFIERLKSADETLTGINENLTKDGRIILCEWYDTPLRDEHGNYAGTMAMVQDITERRQAEEALKRSTEKMRQLSAYLQSVREEERKHIAREIHDELGQELTALKMQVAYVQRALTKHNGPVNTETVSELIASLIGMTDGAIKTVRRIATELRPDVLDKVGLIDALKWQAQEFEKRTGVPCQFISRVEEWSFSDAVATALFRIFQEALTNISRHAAATRVSAQLSINQGWVELVVRDNGRGISREEIENTSSLGLLGLTERAHLLGGTAVIEGEPGKGTVVRVQIPLPATNED